MIHFDFTVDDVDAENIMGCIDAEVNRCITKKLMDTEITDADREWLGKHIDYLNELKEKMFNTRVKI